MRPAARVERDTLGLRAKAPELLNFDTRGKCVFNGGSHDFSRELASGQIATMISGPFREEDTLTLNGAETPLLYRSQTQINFVVPREAGTGQDMALALSGDVVRRMDVVAAKPVWIWNILDDGTRQFPDQGALCRRFAEFGCEWVRSG